MPAQRTGGGPIKTFHAIDNDNRELTLCGRPTFDAAYWFQVDKVTCKQCRREIGKGRKMVIHASS